MSSLTTPMQITLTINPGQHVSPDDVVRALSPFGVATVNGVTPVRHHEVREASQKTVWINFDDKFDVGLLVDGPRVTVGRELTGDQAIYVRQFGVLVHVAANLPHDYSEEDVTDFEQRFLDTHKVAQAYNLNVDVDHYDFDWKPSDTRSEELWFKIRLPDDAPDLT